MTEAATILLPLLAALVQWRWPVGWIAPGAAALTLALALSLPWTGSTAAPLLVAEPLSMLVMVLAAFAWLALAVADALDGPVVPPALPALAVACLQAGLLASGALALVGTGTAALLLVVPLRRPGLTRLAVCALGLAAFGLQGGATLGAVPLVLGLGCACTLGPAAAALEGVALPRPLAILAGPLGGAWLVSVLRLRGLLDANPHIAAPGPMLVVLGLAAMAAAALSCRDAARLAPAATLGFLGASLAGLGVGGAAATAAALLHLALGCLLLTALPDPGWAGWAARAGLAALPPFALFGSALPLLAAARAWPGLAMAACLLWLALAAARLLPRPTPAPLHARLGWVGVGLALVGAWAMPPPLTAWFQAIAAAAP